MTSSNRTRVGRVAFASGVVGTLLVGTSAGVASAVSPDPSSPSNHWQKYLVAPTTPHVTPISTTAISGGATVNGFLGKGGGSVTLTTTDPAQPASVLLDYGVEVMGTPDLSVSSYSAAGTSLPNLSLFFSESQHYMRTPGSSTLATAASAGDTTLALTPPRRGSLTFAVGDTVTIGGAGGETSTVRSVSGSTLTLTTSLKASYPAGASVTSTPGAITGDSAFSSRKESIDVDGNSTFSGAFQGGFRFQAITLNTPGTVVLSTAGVNYDQGGVLSGADDYQGHFLSSSGAFNAMYYDGAYTAQTNMQPVGVSGATQPSVLDGSKRDRAIWSGDLKISGQTIANTLGSNGNDYVKQSLLTLINASPAGGGLHADTLGRNQPYSNSYSHWTLDAATDYYRNTGDTGFAQQILPALESQLAYDTTITDADGLIVTGPRISTTNGGYDWDFYDGAKQGTVTAYNVLYYKSLLDVAYVEQNLGHPDKAASYQQTADRVKAAINATLINPATGAYYLSDEDHSTFAQDGNSLAVIFGVAPQANVDKITAQLKTLWGSEGAEPYSSGSPYSTLISPFVSAFEVEAHYLAGDSAGAEALLHSTWDKMIDTGNPYYTGTFWENYAPNGAPDQARVSLAHGWASGPTAIMTSYVLGVTPDDPGYKTFTVAPHVGSLTWANGVVPTPYGAIQVSWKKTGPKYTLTVAAPAGTIAHISVPSSGDAAKTVQGGTSETVTW